MITFVLCCAVLLLLAVGVLARPLLKPVEGESRSYRLSVVVLTSVSISLLASAMYLGTSNWPWQTGGEVATPTATAAQQAIDALLKKTVAEPDDASTWMELGHVYTNAGSYALASNAFEHAYELTNGQDVDAITGLAETLVMADPSTLNGRVSVLIDQALKLQPNQPKALWYGGMVALQAENLPLARDRFKALLALNPPPQVRSLLERQIQDLSEQLGDASAQAKPAAAAHSNRKVTVKVSLSAALKQQLTQPTALFVLARDRQQPGAPLAVQRHQSTELPIQVELTTADAMLPTRTLATAQEVEIVARLSASGVPTEQSGDYYGRALYSFAKGEQGSVTLEINQRVP